MTTKINLKTIDLDAKKNRDLARAELCALATRLVSLLNNKQIKIDSPLYYATGTAMGSIETIRVLLKDKRNLGK